MVPQNHQPGYAQAASGFFKLPIELRRVIYSYLISPAGVHVYLSSEGALRLSPCLGPDVYSAFRDNERTAWRQPGTPRDPVQIRRLQSTWDPHWACEEVALRLSQMRDASTWRGQVILPTICKRMHLETMNFIAGERFIHVTELKDLDGVIQLLDDASSPALSYGFNGSVAESITKLSITLSLPLAFFQALDTSSLPATDMPAVPSSPPSAPLDKELSVWRALSSDLARFTRLRYLHVWLDHQDEPYWTYVNERAVLSSFESLKASNPSLNLRLILPKLHPKIDNANRHYLRGDADTTPFEICRIVRRRDRVVSNKETGYTWITYWQDFPHTFGSVFEHCSELTDAEMEEFEEGLWRSGVDVIHMLAITH